MELWAQRCSESGCEGKQEMAVGVRIKKGRKGSPRYCREQWKGDQFKVHVPSLLLRAL